MKKIALCGLAALTISSAFADGDLIAAAPQKNDKNKQMSMAPAPMNVVTLTSARPESDNGWYLFADALYWHVNIGSTDWAVVGDNGNVTNAPTKAKDHTLDFKWNWGFRVGLGVNMDHDMWDSNFYYTWLFAENSNRAGKGPTAVVTDNIGAAGVVTAGSSKWDLHFSMFDWELGRWYYVSKNLALRPHVGVKGGWINQKIHSTFENANTIASANHFRTNWENNFWGVGPSAGVNTMWVLGNAGPMMDHRFSLFGDFGGALMYGHFDCSAKQTNTLSGTVLGGVNFHDLNRNLMTTMLQGQMGFSWDVPFNRGRNHFTMKVGYELQYWFRQNQLLNFGTAGATNAYFATRISDDLSLQGVTADFRFDF